MSGPKTILVATDLEEASGKALERALDLARALDATVEIVHAVRLPPYYYSAYAEGLAWPVEELEGEARRALQKTLEAARAQYAKVDGRVIAGEPCEAVVAAAKAMKADLIVVGTHGRRGLPRVVLGSVAEKIVRTSTVPVMTVSAEA